MFPTENEYAGWFECQMKLAKERILEETDGLVTRQTLRDEKWSEYTLRAIVALMEEEGRRREAIVLGESPFRIFYTRWALQLERLVVEGTTGTVIYIEESERPSRSQVEAEEAVGIAYILDPHTVEISRSVHQQLEDIRLEREREECGVLEASEIVNRFDLTEVYEVEWPEIWASERKGRKDVTLLLLWRVVLQECDARLGLEEYEEVYRGSLPALPTQPMGVETYTGMVETAPTSPTQMLPVQPKPHVGAPTQPTTYAHFGHEFSVIPPLRQPGEEPALPTAPAEEPSRRSISVTSSSASSTVSSLDEEDISEYRLLRLRDQVEDAWRRAPLH